LAAILQVEKNGSQQLKNKNVKSETGGRGKGEGGRGKGEGGRGKEEGGRGKKGDRNLKTVPHS
jgi:hypothetical protein